MSRLNKIFYGPSGTGKTREANIEAVKIVNQSKKLSTDIDYTLYADILEKFKSFAKLPDLDISNTELFREIQNLDTSVDDIVKTNKYEGDLKYLTDKVFDREKAKEKILEYRAYPFIETVTFHPSYTYQDFVEGISVETTDKNQIRYDSKDGIFKKICERAINNEDFKYVLIIDEINRGDISSIFGELFTLIEDTKRKGEDEELSINLPYSKDKATGNPKKLIVPKNLHIIATMNTVDKSIALIDVALRRRFDFQECMPDYSIDELNRNIDDINLSKLLKAINERINILKNEHYQIGHSYFLEIENFSMLRDRMKKNIIPLLQEYFYDDWQSICAVLNQPYNEPKEDKGLFTIKKASNKMFADEFNELIEFKNKKIIDIRDFTVDDIKAIYE